MTNEQKKRLLTLAWRASKSQKAYRAGVVATLGQGATYAEVSEVTGLSTNTLQRWKREANS